MTSGKARSVYSFFVLWMFCLIYSLPGFSQAAPVVGVDPSAGASAAPVSQRGLGSQTVATQVAGNSTNVLGSASYTYAVPMLHLPGRNNLDLNLDLYYNSLVWPLTSNSTNADYDNPSLGFRLDFGMFDFGNVFIEPNGSKHPLTMLSDLNPATTWHFVTTDASYIDIRGPKFVGICPGPDVCQQPNLTVTFKNGLQGTYENFNFQHGGGWRPIRFDDTHGNQITISYLNGTTLALSSVTDSVGRVVNFTYDGNGNLASFGYGQRIFRFAWNTNYQANINFGFLTTLPPISVLTGVTRPDGTGVRFIYGDWDIVNEIDELSATGNVRYSTRYNFPQASAGALTTNPTYTTQTVFDGVHSNIQWNYATTLDSDTGLSTVTVTDPTGVTTSSIFSADGLLTQRTITSLDSSGNSKVWQLTNQSWSADASGLNQRLSASATVLDDGSVKGISYLSYDGNGNPTDVKEFDLSAPNTANLALSQGTIPAFGALLRETVTAYASLGLIRNRPSQTLVKDPAGNITRRTDYNYDEGSTTGTHGDLTSSFVYTNAAAGSGGVKSIFSYDSYGNIVSRQEGCCAFTQKSFSAATNFAYPDSTSVGPQGSTLTTSFSYNPDGTLLSTTDPAGLTTSYTYDASGRTASATTSPGGITVNTSYDDAGMNPSTTKSSTVNSLVTTTTTDGLGRTISTQQLNGTSVLSTTAYINDPLGRPIQSSNPFGPADTPVYTTLQYDALGRVVQTTPPALSAASPQNSYLMSYSGGATTTTDPAGHQRIAYHDALGRLVRVDEPGLSNGQAAAGSLTISGVELSVATSSGNGATAGTASVTLNGTERSTSVLTHAATPGSMTVTIGGANSTNVNSITTCTRSGCVTHTFRIADSGNISLTVNAGGTLLSTGNIPYSASSSQAGLAAALFSAFPANALVSISNPNGGNSFTFTALTAGSATNNYSVSTSETSSCVDSDTLFCAGPGWTMNLSGPNLASTTASPRNFTGGTDNVFTTVYDSGNVTVSITANGTTYSKQSTYSQNSTTSSIALDLYNQFNNDVNVNQVLRVTQPGTAGFGANQIGFTTVATGPGTNYPLTVASATSDATDFAAGSTSFPMSASASTFTPGQSGTLFDNGELTLVVNGVTTAAPPSKQITYGQGSNSQGLAAQLAAQIHNDPSFPLDASVPAGSSTITFTTRDQGIAGNNYVVNISGTSNLSASFPNPSFPNSPASSSPASVRLSGGVDPTPSLSPGVALSTYYSYDPMGNLVQVVQGQQTRTYGYDNIGRMTSSCIPERGNGCLALTYTDLGAVKTTTDPRGVVTTYGYDSLNRVNDIQYSDGTPEAKYSYGGDGAANNAAGRLVSTNDGSGSKTFQYDTLGRVIQISQVLAGNSYVSKYGYANGRLTGITYPSGTQVNYAYDPVGRLSSVGVGATTVYSVNAYNAAAQPLGMAFGNGMTGGYTYNKQQQLNSIQYGSSTAALMDLSYNYGGASDNGQILGITDNLVSARSTSYVYDALGRLQQAQTLDQGSPNTWNLRFKYDRYGNRLAEVPIGGTAAMPNSELLVDPTTNHVISTGFGYDGAGNMLNDSAFNYTFDGASRLTSVTSPGVGLPTVSFGYDGGGFRVNKGGNLYIFSGNEVLAEYPSGAAAGSPSAEYIYAGGRRVATLASGALTYHYWDHLSIRASADAQGNPVRSYTHYPFGETAVETGPSGKWKFTSYERDAESGLDYANARFHSPALGRFMSLDPLPSLGGNPQLLNRYPYVGNDPINFIDPTGARGCDPSTTDCYNPGPNFVCLLDSLGDCAGGDIFGGSSDCTIDGQSVGCGIAESVVQMGAGAPCPGNDCTGLVLHDIAPGAASFYQREYTAYLVLECTGFNYRSDCQWTHNSLKWISDEDPILSGNDLLDLLLHAQYRDQYFESHGMYEQPSQDEQLRMMAQQIVQQAGMIDDPRFIGCWYAASASIGALGVDGGLGALADTVLPEAAEDATFGTRLLTNAGRRAIDKGIHAAAAFCGVEGFLK